MLCQLWGQKIQNEKIKSVMDIPIFLTIAIPLLTGLTFVAYKHPKPYKFIFRYLSYPVLIWAGFASGYFVGKNDKHPTGDEIFWQIVPLIIWAYLGVLTLLSMIDFFGKNDD
jgi:hypothetical protein